MDNPYASPISSSVEPTEEPLQQGELATAGQRFGNFFIDNVILQILYVVVGVLYAAVVINSNASSNLRAEEAIDLVAIVLALITTFGYYILTEAIWQRSLGKVMMGTKVVRTDGGKPTFGQILGRTFARMIPFEPLSHLKARPRGWHDSLSGTMVIRSR